MFVTIYSDKLTKGQQLAVKRKRRNSLNSLTIEIVGRIGERHWATNGRV